MKMTKKVRSPRSGFRYLCLRTLVNSEIALVQNAVMFLIDKHLAEIAMNWDANEKSTFQPFSL